MTLTPSATDTSIDSLLAQHDHERLSAINLIVSENRMSARARAPLGSDIQSRYAANFYAGTSVARQIVASATASAAEYVDYFCAPDHWEPRGC
jgi:glycine/serine hydroxymethyltransferase